MRLSPTVKHLSPSPTLAVSSRAKELRAKGHEILDLSLGEPDFPTPAAIREAAKRALDEGHTKYTPVAGIAPLREAICQHLQRRKQLTYRPDQIVVSTGAKQSIYNAIQAIVGPGDEVVVPTPYWVSYPSQIKMAGGTPVYVETHLKDHFQLDPEAIARAITPDTRMLIVNSPNNPTGAVYPRDTMEAIATLLRDNPHVWLLTDDIYDRLVYEGQEAVNVLDVAPDLQSRTVLINGFSKAYAMTGWRIGYMAAPESLAQAAIALQGACTSGSNAPTQYAALTALAPELEPEIERMRQTFDERRKAMCDAFARLPRTTCTSPQGAFYLMVDFSAWLGSTSPLGKILDDTIALATYLLEEGHVACVPGEAFGAPGVIRFAYACSIETIERAARYVTEALHQLKPPAE